jgi:hypothetical protein
VLALAVNSAGVAGGIIHLYGLVVVRGISSKSWRFNIKTRRSIDTCGAAMPIPPFECCRYTTPRHTTPRTHRFTDHCIRKEELKFA